MILLFINNIMKMKRNYNDFSFKNYTHLEFNSDNVDMVLENHFNDCEYFLYKKEENGKIIFKFKYNNIITPVFKNWDELIAIL
jgi:predicted RND superfamily exporter protein